MNQENLFLILLHILEFMVSQNLAWNSEAEKAYHEHAILKIATIITELFAYLQTISGEPETLVRKSSLEPIHGLKQNVCDFPVPPTGKGNGTVLPSET